RIAPDDVLRLPSAHLAEVLALEPVARAQEVPQEILVPLARRAEEVGAPDEKIAWKVYGVVGILAGHAEPAGFELVDDVVRHRPTGFPCLGAQPQRVGGELRRGGQP